MGIRASVFVAMSLDGYIARKNGSIDWLLKASEKVPDGEDFGYAEFMDSVDAIVMGRKTFEHVLAFPEWPYGTKPVIVCSRKFVDVPSMLRDKVSGSDDEPGTIAKKLAMTGARRVYVDGGITIQRFLEAGLIDDLIITVIPVILGEGRPLFGPIGRDAKLYLDSAKPFKCGFIQLKYSLK